jgi:hypothetical protein
MKHLLLAARQAVAQQNFYAGLALALTLPDICGQIERPAETNIGTRYSEWFNSFMPANYVKASKWTGPLMSGVDCYALRCAYLHAGSLDVSKQHRKDILRRFIFKAPTPGGNPSHLVKINDILVLQTHFFVEEVCRAVEQWVNQASSDETKTEKIQSLDQILVGDVRISFGEV